MTGCPSCGQENPGGARFCNACGAPLPEPALTLREERRIVTVLFADMAGFTARAEQLDPEDVRAILDRYYSRMRSEIESFGGTVEKFIGDAVVAFFGAPVAHGDDPERGVRAALALCEAVADMNAADPALDLEVRVAVNTGEVIVSLDRAELHQGMVAGDVVNTASRLQANAPIGGVLVGEETHRATRGVVEYRAVEPLAVKGKRDPVRAWVATCASLSPAERVPSSVPILGREREMAVLQRVLDNVVADRRLHLVTVLGDAGIGKTRLASEFAAEQEQRGTRILRGRSLPYGSFTPYGPFAQHVKAFAGIFASDDIPTGQEKLARALEAIAPPATVAEILTPLELLIGLSTSGDASDRQTLFLAARAFVEVLAAHQPTVLLFEDVHWADTGTLDLLEVLASRVRDVPLMLLALARPDLLLGRPAWGGGLPAYTSLSLEPLSSEDAREMARLLGRRATADALEARVVETAEGNPLFIEELTAAAFEQPTTNRSDLPMTIRELVSARLDVLPPQERGVLLDAAIVGKVFWRRPLERMRQDVGDLANALDALEGRDLIRREALSWIEGEVQYTFKHAIIRDVAYATLPRARRRDMHAVVATFLEESTRGAGATASALAEHWREAGRQEMALEYLLVAADQAGRGWAKDEAARLYGEALELCPEDSPVRRQIVRQQAMALVALQHVPDVRALTRRSQPPPGEVQ
jgi:class 3 adenylate cyclase